MTYAITLHTFDETTTAEVQISKAMGFKAPLSNGTIIDLFAGNLFHQDGIFKNKRKADAVAKKIRDRGAFGGFGKFAVAVEVVKI